MTVDEYHLLYPNERVMRSTLTKANKTSAIVIDGMLKFDEETASSWGGPYEGDYAYFSIKDCRELPGHNKITSIAEHLQRVRLEPFGRFKTPAESEEHLQKRLAELSIKQRKDWEQRLNKWMVDCPTIDKPFALCVCGNDDCSYTKFYCKLEEAQEELTLFLSMEPLNLWLHIVENGFVFTN